MSTSDQKALIVAHIAGGLAQSYAERFKKGVWDREHNPHLSGLDAVRDEYCEVIHQMAAMAVLALEDISLGDE